MLDSRGTCQSMRLGPELGLNLIRTEQLEISNNYQLGLHIGGLFKLEFSDYIGLRSGLYYSQKRQTFASADTSNIAIFSLIGLDGLGLDGLNLNTYSTLSSYTSQHYIQLPVAIDFKIYDFSVYLGGYIGYMISNTVIEYETKRTPLTSTLDLSPILSALDTTGLLLNLLPPPYEESITESKNNDFLSPFDFGFKVGFGYSLDNVEFAGSYLYGIPDFRKNSNLEQQQNHQYFQLSVNYAFDIGLRDAPGFETNRSKRVKLSR